MEGSGSAISSITSALVTGLTTAQGDILATMAAVVPVAVVILGAFMAIRFAVKAFKVTSKAG